MVHEGAGVEVGRHILERLVGDGVVGGHPVLQRDLHHVHQPVYNSSGHQIFPFEFGFELDCTDRVV